MEHTPLKIRLMNLLKAVGAAQQALLDELIEEERAAIGTWERWSAKDHVAHAAAWKLRAADRLGGDRELAHLSAEDTDVINARTYEQQRLRPWQDVLADAAHATNALIAQVERMDESELRATDRFAWQNDQPLWTRIMGAGYWHPMAHLAQWYAERGDLARATEIQEQLPKTLAELDSTPEARGGALYNLACFYATTEQTGHALAPLRETLTLHPDVLH